MSLLSFITKEEPITSLADLELAKGKIQLTIKTIILFIDYSFQFIIKKATHS
mgnify:CR=1 FL=1